MTSLLGFRPNWVQLLFLSANQTLFNVVEPNGIPMRLRVPQRTLIFAIALLAVGIESKSVHAIDYQLEWKFDSSIGETDFKPWQQPNFIEYDASTGDLTYIVAEASHGLWSPPDIVSISGAFLVDTPLQPVPLADRLPWFGQDELITDKIVLGSNGIHIQYDGWKFWPNEVSDPWILNQWNLSSVPVSHSFGNVLPPGLSESFLLSDLYIAGSPVGLVYVPEPSSAILAAIGLAGLVLTAKKQGCIRS